MQDTACYILKKDDRGWHNEGLFSFPAYQENAGLFFRYSEASLPAISQPVQEI